MIPSVLAQQVRQGIEDFLRTTFSISTPFFHGMIERLLAEEGSVFKGPYVSVQLPYRQGTSGPDFFPDVPFGFKPYVHQERAFHRLAGLRPRSTLVATGTGSGKTECFLYPILDYCYRHRGEPGIKAILIYPMNALAADQAGRLARIIWNNPKLKGYVTAGLFVGQSEHEPRMVMDADSIITNKDTQRLTPPDILLTNYKMLDYLLVRPKDFPLWKHNGPETLRYLVVDELHTFDGAQGTDLACLVRRLRARLATPRDYLCCVGTSATLGSNEEQGALRTYAETVFGEPFDHDAIITESRLSAGEFLENNLISRIALPPEGTPTLDPESFDNHPAYIRAQHALWFGETIAEGTFAENEWRVALGERLKEHLFFQNLLKVLGGKVQSYAEILGKLEQVTPELTGAPPIYQWHLLNSMLALISEARALVGPQHRQEMAPSPSPQSIRQQSTTPFLHVRVQYWLRELRRMVAEVQREPRLRFADDLQEEQLKRHMPIVHCRECGSMGWAGMRRQHESAVNPDLQTFYLGFFSNDPKVVFLFPEDGDLPAQKLDGDVYHFCGGCLHLTTKPNPEQCPSCGGDGLMRVFVPNSRIRRNERIISTNDCPYCGAAHSLTVVGSRAASLTSVLIAQLYASSFNDDKKLLTFSDSVQDAAHRAGFFSARTYRFNLRSAVQQCVLAEHEGITLAELPEAFIRYWSARMDEHTYIATFLAPDMLWLRDYAHLTEHGRLPDGSRLRGQVDRRIGWEIYSEYGFTARIGRTLEKSDCSVAHLTSERLDRVTSRLLERLCNEVGELRSLDALTLRRFLVGLVAHWKNQGAILHADLDSYIESQGNTFLLTRKPWMPNFGPRTRAPVFLTTRTGSRFDQLLSASSSRRTWYQGWAEKCFTPINVFISAVTERLYSLVLKTLVEENVLVERQAKSDRIWGLQPEVLHISREVCQFRCVTCGHNVSVAAAEQAYWAGTPCLRFHCSGQYEAQAKRTDYYGKLYATGDVQRLFAAEHTGLLDRDEREKLEQRFKAEDRRPWDPNLLSCTPTLEMGIDIGDLSSVLLCSVPPA